MNATNGDGAWDAYGKRICDVTLAGMSLLVLWPLLLLVALAVWVTMGRPVLYAEWRAGRGGAPFLLRKFRTMTDAQDAAGRLLPDEHRLTSMGRLLRESSIDELPELLNVLKGEMSLVGPRPLPVRYVERYTPRQARRLQVRPGLTGLAQVRGRNALTWEQRFEHDLWYVEHRGPALDLALLVDTIRVVLRREGVQHPGHATMHEFLGSPQ